MSRILALIIRIIRQFSHDKRSLALLFVAPIVIMLMLYLVFNGSEYKPEIAVVNAPETLISKLEEQGAKIHRYEAEKAEQELKDDHIDAVLSINDSVPDVRLEGSDPSVNKAVLLTLQQIFQDGQIEELFKTHVSYLHGSEDMAKFDNFGPVLLGYFSFILVFLLSGVAFLRERTGGTLERLMASPLKRWEIVAGYLVGFGIFAAIQAVLIVLFSIKVLGMMMNGSFWYVLLIALLMACAALTLGIFLSTFANNETQMSQFIPLVIVPQIFFSGLFNVETMAEWLRGIGIIMPLTYAGDALRNIMIRGEGWSAIAADVYVLIGFSLLFGSANVLALKKHRVL
ncbi:ABC transporter permease [Paenibacillus sp. NEAU-GSW1]|uniref:ABC transporter permease n=1 Tax=Paenibacillus sp. NEAU-GSW1 TaxID=2682486 RepID=UPI0012E174EA|nr:ABC transporter permease [Paenibacillus sp. NEAU-GSW1]MUT67430.1 ABC transporter permease subunit [Paenibacillus sp. NEAU-GSW1]